MADKKMSETEFKYLSKKGASNFKAAQGDAKLRSSVKKNLQTAMDVASAPGRFAASMPVGATKNKDDKKMPGALKRLAKMRAKKKMSKMGKAYNKMEKSKDFKPLPFLDGPKRKDVKGGPSDVRSYMKKLRKGKK